MLKLTLKPMTTFKKAYLDAPYAGEALVTLRIPRFTLVRYDGDYPENKQRASRAEAVSIEKLNYEQRTGLMRDVAYSGHDTRFLYAVGKTVRTLDFELRNEKCAPGIHFFINEIDARRW